MSKVLSTFRKRHFKVSQVWVTKNGDSCKVDKRSRKIDSLRDKKFSIDSKLNACGQTSVASRAKKLGRSPTRTWKWTNKPKLVTPTSQFNQEHPWQTSTVLDSSCDNPRVASRWTVLKRQVQTRTNFLHQWISTQAFMRTKTLNLYFETNLALNWFGASARDLNNYYPSKSISTGKK